MILFTSIFVATAVLLSYAVRNPSQFWQRVPQISVFGRNLPPKDVAGEILGSLRNDLGVFFFPGDPNPRYNPSGFPLFDPITSTLVILGAIFLFKKKKKMVLGINFFVNPSPY